MEFPEFRRRISQAWGLNLEGYKERQLQRRIESLMHILQVGSYQDYYQLLMRDPQQKKKFLDRVTINVSEFFRNPEIFKQLEEKIIPGLVQPGQTFRAWSAGCSNGAEAYSLAIIFEEKKLPYRIEATDVDDQILEVARAGRYPASLLRAVTPERLRQYFDVVDHDLFQVKPVLKRNIYYRHHDLLVDRYGGPYDLIVCRNVTIYFTGEIQEELYSKFWQALRPGGLLFVGATESLLQYRQLGYEKVASWFYARPKSVRDG